MARGRACKICELGKSNPEVFNLIENQIKTGKKGGMSKFLRETNKEHGTNIISMNAQRHKTHMEGNVTELKGEGKKGSKQKGTVQIDASEQVEMLSFPDVDPEHVQFLSNYRQSGYRNKEKAWTDAGFKSPKKVYEAMKRPEIRAAIYEMKASDFVAMRYTGNQVLAGLMETAHFPEYWDQACDKDGYLKTDITKWPEELRHAMCGYETTEDVLKSFDGDEDGNGGGEIIRRKFKYKFSDPLKAKMELRKHGMEVEMYKKSVDNAQLYADLMDRIVSGQVSPVMALLEMAKESLPFQDLTKTLLNKADLTQLTEGPNRDGDDLGKASSEELNERLILLENKRQKLCK